MSRTFVAILLAGVLFAQGPVFEVASVKPATPGEIGGQVQFLPGGVFRATNVPLNFLLQRVYQLRDYQIVGDPQWMAVIADGRSARYYTDAKGDPSSSEAEVREMLKTLLAERFQLKVHRETRDLPVYALIPAKAGTKLQVAKDNGRPRGSGLINSVDRGWIQGSNVPMEQLLLTFSTLKYLDRPVIDKTGFTDPFDFRLTWTPDNNAPADTRGDGLCPASFGVMQERLKLNPETWSCPSIFTAVQDQLGLKLDPQKVPTDVLVIDHVERPSAN